MPPSKKPKRPRRSHPVTVRELRDNNPGVAEAVTNKMAPYYKIAVYIAAFGVAGLTIEQIYSWSGAKWVVSDYTLNDALRTQNAQFDVKLGTVNSKIDVTKDTVLRSQQDIKGEITGSLGELNKTLGAVVKSQAAASMDAAEMQQKLAFTQLQSLQGQLATVKQALVKDSNDQAAQTRILQLETFIRQNERDMQDARDKMQRLRSGQ